MQLLRPWTFPLGPHRRFDLVPLALPAAWLWTGLRITPLPWAALGALFLLGFLGECLALALEGQSFHGTAWNLTGFQPLGAEDSSRRLRVQALTWGLVFQLIFWATASLLRGRLTDEIAQGFIVAIKDMAPWLLACKLVPLPHSRAALLWHRVAVWRPRSVVRVNPREATGQTQEVQRSPARSVPSDDALRAELLQLEALDQAADGTAPEVDAILAEHLSNAYRAPKANHAREPAAKRKPVDKT